MVSHATSTSAGSRSRGRTCSTSPSERRWLIQVPAIS
jgi:hypothetical protein